MKLDALNKSFKFDLTKDSDILKHVAANIQWNTNETAKTGKIDVDICAFGLIPDGKGGWELFDEDHFIYFKNPNTSSGSIVHSGDDLTGDNGGENIDFNFTLLPEAISSVSIFLTINKAQARGHDFSLVSGSELVIKNKVSEEVLCSYQVEKEFRNKETIVQVGSFVKGDDGMWEFLAIGEGMVGDLQTILESYGVEFE